MPHHLNGARKKIQAKKNSWNQINQFHEKIFFDQIPFFCHFKNGQSSIFELRNAISQKIIFDLLDFTNFFAWTFFSFSGPLWKTHIFLSVTL